MEILRLLQDDARLSFRELARRIGVSVPTVSARVAELESIGVLAGYRAVVEPERLGLASVVAIVRCRPARADAVARSLAAMPEVRRALRLEGDRVFAEAAVSGSEAVGGFLARLQRLEGVLGVEGHVATGRVKDAPRAVVGDGAAAVVHCFECRQVIQGEPVRLHLDGRVHYMCCPTCERLYRQRYARLQAGTKGRAR